MARVGTTILAGDGVVLDDASSRITLLVKWKPPAK
jgi:hypothetical protein